MLKDIAVEILFLLADSGIGPRYCCLTELEQSDLLSVEEISGPTNEQLSIPDDLCASSVRLWTNCPYKYDFQGDLRNLAWRHLLSNF